MKTIKLFYLKGCPYCIRALGYLDEILSQEKFRQLGIEMIEESENAALASTYDYYYVPCFYINEEKVHEGVSSYEDVLAVCVKALDA